VHQTIVTAHSFYTDPEIARSYDEQRYGGAGGAWVNDRELREVQALLPGGGTVLDLACGTGRLALSIAGGRYRPLAADISRPMLQIVRAEHPIPAVQSDAFVLPFRDGAFDAVVALRLLFHYRNPGPILREMRRVVCPGGAVVFDLYRWSPRSLLALGSDRWGQKVYIHSDAAVREMSSSLGMRETARKTCFLISPYVYRLLPLGLDELMERIESYVPDGLRERTYWRFQREN
jgi:ubiquinone/menaquinone biosynthesis C-methylase UbiE